MSEESSPVFLHVGCGPQNQNRTPFAGKNWREIRLDIDQAVQPDVIGTMTDMKAVDDASMDAIFSSHNIEHLYPHEVPMALAEFNRVLKPGGFVLITCPDLQSVCALVANDQLVDPAYQSGMGPITPLDILYGHRVSMQQGNLYMAHRCGFTKKVLAGTLLASGFPALSRSYPQRFALWAVGVKEEGACEARLHELADEYLPRN
jgi:predicted SAM-dependent methyltransferase